MCIRDSSKNLGIEIPDYRHIDINFVKRNTSAHVLALLRYRQSYTRYYSVEFAEKTVTFTTPNAEANVMFYMEDEKVYVKSPQSKKPSRQLSSDQAQCLTMIRCV